MSIMNRLNVLIDQDYEGNEATFNFFTRGGRKKNDSEVEVFVIYCRGKSYF